MPEKWKHEGENPKIHANLAQNHNDYRILESSCSWSLQFKENWLAKCYIWYIQSFWKKSSPTYVETNRQGGDPGNKLRSPEIEAFPDRTLWDKSSRMKNVGIYHLMQYEAQVHHNLALIVKYRLKVALFISKILIMGEMQREKEQVIKSSISLQLWHLQDHLPTHGSLIGTLEQPFCLAQLHPCLFKNCVQVCQVTHHWGSFAVALNKFEALSTPKADVSTEPRPFFESDGLHYFIESHFEWQSETKRCSRKTALTTVSHCGPRKLSPPTPPNLFQPFVEANLSPNLPTSPQNRNLHAHSRCKAFCSWESRFSQRIKVVVPTRKNEGEFVKSKNSNEFCRKQTSQVIETQHHRLGDRRKYLHDQFRTQC